MPPNMTSTPPGPPLEAIKASCLQRHIDDPAITRPRSITQSQYLFISNLQPSSREAEGAAGGRGQLGGGAGRAAVVGSRTRKQETRSGGRRKVGHGGGSGELERRHGGEGWNHATGRGEAGGLSLRVIISGR